MTTIYILRLEGGRYYVGKTNNVMKRYAEHQRGYGSSWTRKYKPVSIERTIENASPFEEDKMTKEYMCKYGIDRVRGGSYVEITLSEFQIEALNLEIWGAKNLCKQCGCAGHFQKDCYAGGDSDSDYFEELLDNDACYRCGRDGHYSSECYARTDVNGEYIR